MTAQRNRRHLALYRFLLGFLPARFHIRFGPAMENDFGELLTDSRTIVARARAWITALWDLAFTFPREWKNEIMNNRRGRLGVFAALTDSIGRDIKFSIRSLARSPGYTLAALLTLTLGIGANTAVFSLANWALLRPIPGVHEEAELVSVRIAFEDGGGWIPATHSTYTDFRDGTSELLQGFTAYHDVHSNVAVSARSGARQLDAQMVPRNFFSVLGVRMEQGEFFGPAEEGSVEMIAVVSHRFWSADLGGDPTAIGSEILVNGRSVRVIGVAPRGFHGPESPGTVDIWFPAEMVAVVSPTYAEMFTSNRLSVWFTMVGRLRPGVSLPALDAALQSVWGAEDRPGARFSTVAPEVVAGIGPLEVLERNAEKMMLLLSASVGLLLILAAANVANMMLARSSARSREMAVRGALGAGRFVLIRQMVTESLVLSTAGAVAALLAAGWLVSFFEGYKLAQWLPDIQSIEIDYRVLGFTALVAVITGVAFGLAPAIASSGLDYIGSLRDGTGGTSRSPRLRAALVVGQVALSLVLVVGALLMAGTLANLRNANAGLQLDRRVSFALDANIQGYDDRETRMLFRDIAERLEARPEIRDVSIAAMPPFGRMRAGASFRFPEASPEEEPKSAGKNFLGSGFFATMGIPIVAGREFAASDMPAQTRTAGVVPTVVNESFVTEFLAGRQVLGAQLVDRYYEELRYEVVGVAGDAQLENLAEEVEPALFVPVGTSYYPKRQTFVVRARERAELALAAVATVVREVDPIMPPAELRILADAANDSISGRLLVAKLSTAMSVLALLVAAAGLYGVVSYSVTERSREFGIRMALGARSEGLVRGVLLRALRLGVVGVAIGVVGATQFTKLIESQLWGVEPLDPRAFLVAGAILLGTVAVAAIVPALQSARVDPADALRAE